MPRRGVREEGVLKVPGTGEKSAGLLRSLRRLQNSMRFEKDARKRALALELMVHDTKVLQRLLEAHFDSGAVV